jgi:excinuclease ABC subunit B
MEVEEEKAKPMTKMTKEERQELIVDLEKQMRSAAKKLDFETAADLRDILMELKAM